MKRIPLEQRLRAAVTGDTLFLSAFCLFPRDFFPALHEMTGNEAYADRYEEFKDAFPDYENKILAEIVYESVENKVAGYIDLLYVMLVEPFIDPLQQ